MDMTTHREAWQRVIKNTSHGRPSVGKRVVVTDGKKYKGKIGIVRWHGVNKYSDAFRYADNAQSAMREITGKWGYRVRVETDNGESFFVDADKVEVVSMDNAIHLIDMIVILGIVKGQNVENISNELASILPLL